MYGILQRREERSGGDRQERLTLSMAKMFGRERGGPLFTMHDYWQAKCRRHDLPEARDFPPHRPLPPEAARRISWIDMASEDPFDFVLRNHLGLTPGFECFSDRRLGDHPSPMNAKSCAAEYLLCVRSRQPIYHEIDQILGGLVRQYVRLMLPAVDATGKVVRLVYVTRMLDRELRGVVTP